jgi:RNA polymerase sigma-70 factor (ECF subfamily)
MNLATHYDPLVERLQMRDQQAFDELLHKYGARMYGTARRFTSDEAGAKEVVQDTLINVWRNIGRFQGRASLSSWLYRITVNAGLMRLRKAKQGTRFESIDADGALDHLAETSEDNLRPDMIVLRKELGEQLRVALNDLPKLAGTTVMLADVEGLSVSEIATFTETTEGSVRSRLHRARLALRRKLLPYLESEPPVSGLAR